MQEYLIQSGADVNALTYPGRKPGNNSPIHVLVENGWITPTIFSTLCPGVGADHRRWMASWPHIGFAVNTIGSPSVGHITASGEVGFRGDAGQMGLVHETLADMVDGYLHAGAVEVGLAGVRSWDDGALRFDPSWRGRRAAICRQIQRAAPTAEHLALSSGHPQGGLGFGRTAQEGAVGADYRVHGTRNLYVADASLFPSTITINPQWMVMALGWAAGAAIGESIRSVGRD